MCSYTGVGQDVQGTLAGGLRRSLRTPVRRGAVTAAGRVGSKGEVAGAGARNRRSTVSIGRPQPAAGTLRLKELGRCSCSHARPKISKNEIYS
jgi:hypothetical protein